MRRRTVLGAALVVGFILVAASAMAPPHGAAQRAGNVKWRITVISGAQNAPMRIFDIPGRQGTWSPPDDLDFAGWQCRVGDVILDGGAQERSLRCRLRGPSRARVSVKSFCNPRRPAGSPVEVSLRSGEEPESRVILECVAN